jgi:hypothetical protein
LRVIEVALFWSVRRGIAVTGRTEEPGVSLSRGVTVPAGY